MSDDASPPKQGSLTKRLLQKIRPPRDKPLEVDESETELVLKQGPTRPPLRYLGSVFVEALFYGVGLGAISVIHALRNNDHRPFETRLTLTEWIGGALTVGGTMCLILMAFVVPMLIYFHREQLDWRRVAIDEEGLHLGYGRWPGRKTTVDIGCDRFEQVRPEATLTEHVDIYEEREVLDLTLETTEHFETIAEALAVDEARRLAETINHRLARAGSPAAVRW